MKNSYEVCMKLLRAESEAEVLEIIGETPEMQDEANWRYLGDNSQNNSLISSQSSAGIKALTELMTNMVDAILLKKADEASVDRRGHDAPQSIQDAVNRWIHQINGRLSKLGTNNDWVRKYAAENLVVAISGKDTRTPCFTFVDTGEGQSPQDFPDTFMSLPTNDDSEGRKDAIKFVQGKHNMGSSGVLRYAGKNRLKLIISRRYDESGAWGWTITRKIPNPNYTPPRTQYFILKNSSAVPSFAEEAILPLVNKLGEEFEGLKLAAGSVVKLFDYRIGKRTASQLRWHRPFYENLTDTMLPFRFLDCRVNKSDKDKDELRRFGIDARIFCGLEAGAVEYSTEDFDAYFEQGFKDSDRMIDLGRAKNPNLGEISFRCILLDEQVPEWLRETSHRIFHSVNGQVHFKQSRGEIGKCGFKAIQNRLLINIDASNLTDEAHTEVWQGNREDIAETDHGDDYISLTREFLSKSDKLKKLNQLVREKRISELKSEGRKAILENLLKNSPQMRFLLGNEHPNIDVTGDDTITPETEITNYEGEYSPTFLELKSKQRKIGVRVNNPRAISLRTDVADGYLTRSENQGKLLIPKEIIDNFQVYDYLESGELQLFLRPLEGVAIGQKFEAMFGLSDDTMTSPEQLWTDKIELEIIPALKKDEDEDEGDQEDEEEEKPAKQSSYDEPNFSLLIEKMDDAKKEFLEQEFGVQVASYPEWFTVQDGGYAEDLGEGHIEYFINYENVFHINARRQLSDDTDKRLLSHRYIYSMLLMMMGFENSIRNHKIPAFKEDEGVQSTDLFRRMAASGAASAVLVISEGLDKSINIKNVASDQDD